VSERELEREDVPVIGGAAAGCVCVRGRERERERELSQQKVHFKEQNWLYMHRNVTDKSYHDCWRKL